MICFQYGRRADRNKTCRWSVPIKVFYWHAVEGSTGGLITCQSAYLSHMALVGIIIEYILNVGYSLSSEWWSIRVILYFTSASIKWRRVRFWVDMELNKPYGWFLLFRYINPGQSLRAPLEVGYIVLLPISPNQPDLDTNHNTSMQM